MYNRKSRVVVAVYLDVAFKLEAYDFHENSDLFYKEASDGVNVMVIGSYGQWSDNVALVGGNSSLQILDWNGEELSWTVTSKICAMVLLDNDKDGENELVIGCEDSYIRVVKRGQVIQELPETGAVVQLTAAGDAKFGYALANGTVGIYDEGVRIWRVKSKQTAVSVAWCGDALAACWAGGRVDWRDGGSGRALRRVQTRGAAAAMLLADYRSQGSADLVCVTETGEVVGYPLHVENTGFPFHSTKSLPSEDDRLAITELFSKKQALLLELQHYEANSNVTNLSDGERNSSAMPTNTRLQVAVTCLVDEKFEKKFAVKYRTADRALAKQGVWENEEIINDDVDGAAGKSKYIYITVGTSINNVATNYVPISSAGLAVERVERAALNFAIATNNDTVVRAAVVLAEGVFPGETAARHPPKDKLRPHLFLQLKPPRDVPVDVHVKALVGYPDSEQFHIFELSKQLPRFAMYTLASESSKKSKRDGQVTFKITERIQRICIWLNQNFLLEKEVEPETDDAKELHVDLINLRDKSKLALYFESDGTVNISTHDIRLAGDLVQSLALYLNVADLQVSQEIICLK
ncbi:Bardet-Biedl syndrome 2 protein homolog [Eumeta japonica]|uniref:Bardet-Biedl syndrome 2 protein homolog n=1 Tax=Eumeta variegata TaxID=151549 RepID=A0A4C1VC96_EUMVA|nr:Bardet-Biedl syndrome 2 protein homolog [Eumeta japonica]